MIKLHAVRGKRELLQTVIKFVFHFRQTKSSCCRSYLPYGQGD